MNKPMQDNRKTAIRNRLIIIWRIAAVSLLCAVVLMELCSVLGVKTFRPVLRAVFRVLKITGSNPPASLILGLILIVQAELPFMFPLRKKTDDEADENPPED